jgi:branched-chain amino acid transport system substrate-binding protein
MLKALAGVIAAVLLLSAPWPEDARAQGKKLKIGVIFDYTGPLAGGGSDLHALGAKIMIDYFAKKGGVEGYAIEAVYADAQSKPEVAINEAVRLIEQEKVDMVLGFYSSAQCVPVAARVEQLKKFMWITTCISSAVLENRNLSTSSGSSRAAGKRPDVDRFHRQNTKPSSTGAEGSPRGDHSSRGRAYGVDACQGQRRGGAEGRLQHRAEGGKFRDGADLSPLVTKLRYARIPTSSSIRATIPTSRCSCPVASSGCAFPRWSATAPATASTTSSRKRSARTCSTSSTSTRSRSGSPTRKRSSPSCCR